MRVAIDFTPLRADGLSVGEARLAIETVRGLSREPNCRLVLLTSSQNHELLSGLDCANVRRVCVAGDSEGVVPLACRDEEPQAVPPPQPRASAARRAWTVIKKPLKAITPYGIVTLLGRHKEGIKRTVRRFRDPVRLIIKPIAKRVLPESVKRRLKLRRQTAAPQPVSNQPTAAAAFKLLKERRSRLKPNYDLSKTVGEPIDALYCPFTAVNYFDSGIRIVAAVSDVGHRAHPHFFTPAEFGAREAMLDRLAVIQPVIIAPSDYVRDACLASYTFDPARIIAVRTPAVNRFDNYSTDDKALALLRLGLQKDGYMLYPADFYEYNNHLTLFTAYRMYIERKPDDAPKLALIACGEHNRARYTEWLELMGLAEHTVIIDCVNDVQTAALYESCRYMVYPVLFDGGESAVMDAMLANATVLCSDIASLRDTTGGCAVYFDPRMPDSMLDAMLYADGHSDELAAKKAGYAGQLKKHCFDGYLRQCESLLMGGERA